MCYQDNVLPVIKPVIFLNHSPSIFPSQFTPNLLSAILIKMFNKKIILYLAIGFLVLGCFINEVEGRRKILRGRKTITRQYYRGLAIPAWTIVLLSGLAMLTVGGGLYLVLKKVVVDSSDDGTTNSYHPAIQDDV